MYHQPCRQDTAIATKMQKSPGPLSPCGSCWISTSLGWEETLLRHSNILPWLVKSTKKHYISLQTTFFRASQVGQQKRIWLPCMRYEFNPWVGKIPWSWKWQPTPVFLPRKFHGQRSLAVHGVTKSQTELSDWTTISSLFYGEWGKCRSVVSLHSRRQPSLCYLLKKKKKWISLCIRPCHWVTTIMSSDA